MSSSRHLSPLVTIGLFSVFVSLFLFVYKFICITKKFYIQLLLYDICICLTLLSVMISRLSMFLKIALFLYPLWLRTIPRLLYLVICQRTFRLLPCLGYYKPPMFKLKRAQGLKIVPKSHEVIGDKSFTSQVILLNLHWNGLKVTTGSFFGERTRVLGLFNQEEKFICWKEKM